MTSFMREKLNKTKISNETKLPSQYKPPMMFRSETPGYGMQEKRF